MLYLGDCLEIMPTLASGSVDMVFCDLPYGMTACAWDAVIPFDRLWSEYKRLVKPGAAIILTGSQPFTSALIMSNLKWFQCEWIWDKNLSSNFGAAKHQPLKEHENVIVFRAPGKERTYNPIYQKRTEKSLGNIGKVINSSTSKEHNSGMKREGFVRDPISELRLPRSVQRFETNRRAMGLHPTQKPVELVRYLIRTYSNKGNVVLDNAMGSGTTGVAALNEKRAFVGIEKDPGYFEVASRRIGETEVLPLAAE